MSELSPTTKALLRAAREDGPDAAARAQIWSGIGAQAAGGVTIGAGAVGGKVATGATAKLLVMGALFGSAVTVGVATVLFGIATPTVRPDSSLVARDRTALEAIAPAAPAGPHDSARLEETSAAPLAPTPAGGVLAKRALAERGRGSSANRPGPSEASATEDSLSREAELVAEARGAIVRGEPSAALHALHAAQRLPAHALEPEELSLEVRALRALGRLDEANAAEARLRARFPDHALAR